MLFGLIDGENRSRPLHTGQRAVCPFCKGELIAKCGDIYINHWQHRALTDCDFWKENEGEWHKVWKAHFPEENQEVIVTNGSEKHIADIKTNKGTVIEFQNSFIASNTIAIRETFYGDMIWVINAESFVKNLKIRSLVKRHLKFNKDVFIHKLFDQDAFYDEIIQNYKDDIKKWQRKKEQLKLELNSARSNLNSFTEATNSFETFCIELTTKFHNSSLFESYSLRQIYNSIDDELIKKYKECLLGIERLLQEKNQAENWIVTFLTYSDLDAEQINYKIIPPNIEINSDNFANIFAVCGDEISSFFPNVISFKNKADLDRIKRNPNYCLLAKKNDFLEGRKAKISAVKEQIKELEENKTRMLSEIKIAARNHLLIYATKYNNIISELSKETAKCDHIIRNVSESLIEAEKNKICEHEKMRESIKAMQKASDIEIMKKYKGLYLFEWKNKRKSWGNSQKPIYLDIGENYLFEILQEDCLKKVDKQEFIKMHLV